ncbi:uncharacterized protein LOC134822087 [Bolinopsis microptera]|uniref:uncharacterized protein LOC134822087 n=1 Tax=Bolinopsis microptera TaxID=2820187 RepID=UPI003079E5B8
MTRIILFIWALTVPLSAAPVPRSLYQNISNSNSTAASPVAEVLEIAGSDDSAIKVAFILSFIAVLSAILLACLMVGFFVKTTKKLSELAKLLERDNSINKDLESGLREEMKPEEDQEIVKSHSQIDFKPKNYHKQRMLMRLKEAQKEHPLAKMTSMEKVSQRKRRRRTLRSRNERNKGTTLKIYPAMDVSDTELSPGEVVKCHYPFPKHQKKLIWPNKYKFIPQDLEPGELVFISGDEKAKWSPYEFKESDSVSLSFGEEKLDNETSGHKMEEIGRDPRKMEQYENKETSPIVCPEITAKKSFKKPSRRPPPKHKIKNQEVQSEAERVLVDLDEILCTANLHPVITRSKLTKANKLSSARERRLTEKRKTDQTVRNTAIEETLKIENKGDSLCIEVERDDVTSSTPTILPPNPSPVTPVPPKECLPKLSPNKVTLAPQKFSATSQLNDPKIRRPEAKSTLATARRQQPRNKNARLATQTPPPKHAKKIMFRPGAVRKRRSIFGKPKSLNYWTIIANKKLQKKNEALIAEYSPSPDPILQIQRKSDGAILYESPLKSNPFFIQNGVVMRKDNVS